MPQATVDVNPEGRCKGCRHLKVETYWKRGRGYQFQEYWVCSLGRYWRDCKEVKG